MTEREFIRRVGWGAIILPALALAVVGAGTLVVIGEIKALVLLYMVMLVGALLVMMK